MEFSKSWCCDRVCGPQPAMGFFLLSNSSMIADYESSDAVCDRIRAHAVNWLVKKKSTFFFLVPPAGGSQANVPPRWKRGRNSCPVHKSLTTQLGTSTEQNVKSTAALRPTHIAWKEDAYQRNGPFHWLCTTMAVSQGASHELILARWHPTPRAPICVGPACSSHLRLSAHSRTPHTAHSSSCAGGSEKPSQRKIIFANPLGFAKVLVRGFAQNFAAPGAQHVRLRVRSSFLQEGLGAEQCCSA